MTRMMKNGNRLHPAPNGFLRLKLVRLHPAPNGFLRLKLGWNSGKHEFVVAGGPYDAYPGPDKSFGVCVREERVPKELDVHLPIKDFSVPRNDALVRQALVQTLRAAIDGRYVYIGCAGGWGRTGLFLALLAKVAGVDDSVAYVRKHYSHRAVETEEQRAYVRGFDVGPVRREVMLYGWKARITMLLFRIVR